MRYLLMFIAWHLSGCESHTEPIGEPDVRLQCFAREYRTYGSNVFEACKKLTHSGTYDSSNDNYYRGAVIYRPERLAKE